MSRGRFAPSPTGRLHVGNLRTAMAAWLFARSAGSEFLLRFEDLDHATARREHEDDQRRDLEVLGLDWDGVSVRQSERLERYEDALADLTRRGLTYRCWCSRREIREAASAPHVPSGQYPGTCRHLTAGQIAGRLYFISTLGSALGTLATSFYLVLWFEVDAILMTMSAVLAAGGVSAMLAYWSHRT